MLNVYCLALMLNIAAAAGNSFGYLIGRMTGPRIFTREDSLLFNKKHVFRAQEFYARHGRKAIVLAQFMPIIRTFSPVVAGVGRMPYRQFLVISVFGTVLWVWSMLFTGLFPRHVYSGNRQAHRDPGADGDLRVDPSGDHQLVAREKKDGRRGGELIKEHDMAFQLPDLPYGFDALEPHIDTATMQIHHGKHHQAYVNNLNAAIEKAPELASKSLDDLIRGINSVPEAVRTAVRNNGGGHWNHSMFWNWMAPNAAASLAAKSAAAINDAFGGFDKFKEQFGPPPARAASDRDGRG